MPVGPHDDILELLGGLQTPFDVDLQFQEVAAPLHADRTGRRLDILPPDSGHHLLDRHPHCRQTHRIEPDTHRVVVHREDLRRTDAGDTRDLVFDVGLHIVAQVQNIDLFGVGQKGDHAENIVRTFLNLNTNSGHFRRKNRLGALHGVLDVDLRHVGVRAVLEDDRELVGTAVRTVRGIIEKVLQAVDFRFDRGGDRIGDHLGARPGVDGGDRHLRRRDLGILGDREVRNRDRSGKHKNERNNDRQLGTVDKQLRNHGLSFSSSLVNFVFRPKGEWKRNLVPGRKAPLSHPGVKERPRAV